MTTPANRAARPAHPVPVPLVPSPATLVTPELALARIAEATGIPLDVVKAEHAAAINAPENTAVVESIREEQIAQLLRDEFEAKGTEDTTKEEPVETVATPEDGYSNPETSPHALASGVEGGYELTPGEYMLYSLIDEVGRRVDLLTDAVRTIGQQQQYMTDTVQQMFGQFSGMMSGGGMMKMLGTMMKGGNKNGG